MKTPQKSLIRRGSQGLQVFNQAKTVIEELRSLFSDLSAKQNNFIPTISDNVLHILGVIMCSGPSIY